MKPSTLITFGTFAFVATVAQIQAQDIAQPKPLSLPAEVDVSVLKTTGRQAIAEVMGAFAENQADTGSKSYIILPLGKDIDRGYFTLQFENMFAQKAGAAGFKLYTRTDDVLKKVLTEVAFQQNFEDSLDQATIQKLKFIGAEAVVLPRIDIDTSSNGAITVRASISVHNVASAEKVWGDEVSKVIAGKLTQEEWLFRGGMALALLGGVVCLVWFGRTVRAAARPR